MDGERSTPQREIPAMVWFLETAKTKTTTLVLGCIEQVSTNKSKLGTYMQYIPNGIFKFLPQ